MALAFYMFSIAVVVALLALILCAVRFGRGDFRTQASVVTLVCLFVSYGVGLGLVCYDPHFIDNGVEAFIEWRFRWAWGIMFAGLWQFAIVPVGLAVYGYWRYRRNVAV